MPRLPLVALEPYQAAFVLQRHPIVAAARGGASAIAVKASLRRAERLIAKGTTNKELLAQSCPALPISYDGAGRRRVPLWAARQLVADDQLATHFLEAIISRRLRCPHAASPSLPAPSFYDELDRL